MEIPIEAVAERVSADKGSSETLYVEGLGVGSQVLVPPEREREREWSCSGFEGGVRGSKSHQ